MERRIEPRGFGRFVNILLGIFWVNHLMFEQIGNLELRRSFSHPNTWTFDIENDKEWLNAPMNLLRPGRDMLLGPWPCKKMNGNDENFEVDWGSILGRTSWINSRNWIWVLDMFMTSMMPASQAECVGTPRREMQERGSGEPNNHEKSTLKKRNYTIHEVFIGFCDSTYIMISCYYVTNRLVNDKLLGFDWMFVIVCVAPNIEAGGARKDSSVAFEYDRYRIPMWGRYGWEMYQQKPTKKTTQLFFNIFSTSISSQHVAQHLSQHVSTFNISQLSSCSIRSASRLKAAMKYRLNTWFLSGLRFFVTGFNQQFMILVYPQCSIILGSYKFMIRMS